MYFSKKTALTAALLSVAEARFSQEQAVAGIIGQLSDFGQAGQAATLAGASPGVLLAAANPCAKLQLADQIVTELGNDPAVISAAAQLVAAEQNFNPFAVSIPSICSEATLPATAELRGIVPLVDPAVTGSDVENANSAQSLKTPFDATGLSVAAVMQAQGFSNFTEKALDGSTGATGATGGGATGAATNAAAATTAAANNAAADNATAVDTGAGAVATTQAAAAGNAGATGKKGNKNKSKCGFITVTKTADAATATAVAAAADTATAGATDAATSNSTSGASTGATSGVQQSTVAGLDFGLCVPTMKREPGLNGRSVDEFTFQAIDPLVNKGQQEALNPNIITNRICDQLTNVCQANDAAKTACKAAQAKILALGTRDDSTANAWNAELGFAGTNLNPDGAPQPGLVGHT